MTDILVLPDIPAALATALIGGLVVLAALLLLLSLRGRPR
jgi:hypothetical protein